ncbi:hypothetical protein ACFW16_19600 [Inquilinus sp. NPDC058860]|uniref:hypothetical protein n=1 Tax=Inquilinus sp. NPDC058860 TaxID=3346652 RepID=UPI0036AD3F09
MAKITQSLLAFIVCPLIVGGCKEPIAQQSGPTAPGQNLVAIADAYVSQRNPKMLEEYPSRYVWAGGGKWVVEYYSTANTDTIGGGLTITIDKATNKVDGYWLGQ